MKDNKLGTPRLVFGVGINDADYVTEKKVTIGYVGGIIPMVVRIGFFVIEVTYE